MEDFDASIPDKFPNLWTTTLGTTSETRKYDAFISYSHAADTALAAALKTNLEKFAKPWYRLRSARIFRDDTSLTASPHLWANIANNLEDSAYLILLASTTSADSKWVRKEVCHWITAGACSDPDRFKPGQINAYRAERVLIVLTEGCIVWDDNTGDFDWSKTNALPHILSGVFEGEPCWLDLTWTRAERALKLDRSHEEFTKVVAKLSAPIRGLDIELLIGEDRRELGRQLRHFRRLSIGLGIAMIIALAFGLIAVWQRRAAERSTEVARSQLSKSLFQHGLTEYDGDRIFRAFRDLHHAASLLPDKDPKKGAYERVLYDRLTHGGATFPTPIRHKERVTCIAFSPLGAAVLTGSTDGTAKLSDAETGLPIGSPMKCGTWVSAVAFSPDGRFAATANSSGEVQGWDAATATSVGARIRIDTDRNAWIRRVTFSSDGRFLVTAAEDNTARIFDAHNGLPIGPPLKHASWLTYASFVCGDTQVLTTTRDGALSLWDVETSQLLYSVRATANSINALDMTTDGTRFVIGCYDGKARVFEVATRQQLCEINPHAMPIMSVAFTPDGDLFAATSSDGITRIYDGQSGKQKGDAITKAGGKRVAFSPDGALLLTCGENQARLWDHHTGEPFGQPMIPGEDVNDAIFSPDGTLVLTGSGNVHGEWGLGVLWDVMGGDRTLHRLDNGALVRSVAFSQDGKHVAIGGMNRAVRISDTQNGEFLETIMKHDGPITAVAFSPDDKILASSSQDGTVRVWRATDGTAVVNPLKHADYVSCMVFSRNGKILATGSDDGIIQLWDYETGLHARNPLVHENSAYSSLLSSIAMNQDGSKVVAGGVAHYASLWPGTGRQTKAIKLQHDGVIRKVLFSPDGRMVVTASADWTVRMWNSDSGKQIGQSMRCGSDVDAIAISRDGRRIVSGTRNGIAQLWDPKTSEEIGEPMRHSNAVNDVAFSPSGETLLTASADRTVRLWDGWTGVSLGRHIPHRDAAKSAVFDEAEKMICTGSGAVKITADMKVPIRPSLFGLSGKSKLQVPEPVESSGEVVVWSVMPSSLAGTREVEYRIGDTMTKLGETLRLSIDESDLLASQLAQDVEFVDGRKEIVRRQRLLARRNLLFRAVRHKDVRAIRFHLGHMSIEEKTLEENRTLLLVASNVLQKAE